MVFVPVTALGDRRGAVTRVAQQLGIGPESLRLWVRQAEVDGGHHLGRDRRLSGEHPGTTLTWERLRLGVASQGDRLGPANRLLGSIVR